MYSNNEMILWSMISNLTKVVNGNEILRFNSSLLFKIFHLSILTNTNIFRSSKNIKKIFFDTFSKTKSMLEITNFFCSNELKKFEKRVEFELELLKLYNISYITYLSKDYPEKLKNIKVPPYVLYYKGKLKHKFYKAIAIVGTRKPEDSLEEFLKDSLDSLKIRNFSVVSGLARGCDTLVHKTSLDKNIINIAILGQGLSREFYPKENKMLGEDIIKSGGVIISEVPPSFPVKSIYLLQRNRLQVAISEMILILEMKKKGGTFYTLKIAKSEKKKIFIKYSLNHKKEFENDKQIKFLKTGKEIENHLNINKEVQLSFDDLR